jgi:thiol:disulfide interchange protein DsbD
VGPLANYGYSGQALHPASLHIPADWPVGEPVPVRAQAHWLVCEEHCVPESAVLDLRLRTGAKAGPSDPAVRALFERARAGLPHGTLAGAVLGEKPCRYVLRADWISPGKERGEQKDEDQEQPHPVP